MPGDEATATRHPTDLGCTARRYSTLSTVPLLLTGSLQSRAPQEGTDSDPTTHHVTRRDAVEPHVRALPATYWRRVAGGSSGCTLWPHYLPQCYETHASCSKHHQHAVSYQPTPVSTFEPLRDPTGLRTDSLTVRLRFPALIDMRVTQPRGSSYHRTLTLCRELLTQCEPTLGHRSRTGTLWRATCLRVACDASYGRRAARRALHDRRGHHLRENSNSEVR